MKKILEKKYIDDLIAFGLPIVILSLVFTILQIYPFGSHNVINSDLYLQYLPIMSEFQSILKGGGSILYSFHGGLGSNFYALSAYQNFSPITILFLLVFEENQLILCTTLMIFAKIGLSSLSMYYYLKKNYSKEQILLMAFAIVYALSGYVIAYYFNVMWLDSVILLPLVIHGLRKVMNGERKLFYILSLSFLLITNYYLGAILCIFVGLYSVVYLLKEKKEGFGRSILSVVGASLLSIGMAMFVLLPSFYAVIQTPNFESMGRENGNLFYHSFSTWFTQLLPGSYVTTGYGPANLYSGLVMVLLFFFYLLNKEVDRRKKIIDGVFLGFLLLSTNLIPLDYGWHFFHFPNALPARYSFVLTFMMIEIGVESFEALSSLTKKDMIISFGCVGLIYFSCFFLKSEYPIDYRFLLGLGIGLLVLYGYVFFVMEEQREYYLSFIVIIEILIVSVHGIGFGGMVESNLFHNHKEDIEKLVSYVEENDPDARLEILGTDQYNAPYVYHYKGASIYASSISRDAYAILNGILNEGESETNRFQYEDLNVESDALLNLGYYISLDEKLDDPSLEFVKEENGCYLYKNPYPTSIGYMVPSSLENWSMDKEGVLDSFIQYYGESSFDEVYSSLQKESLEVTKMEGNRFEGKIHSNRDGILLLSIPYDEGWKINVDGSAVLDTERIEHFLSIPLEKGDHIITMKFVPKGLGVGIGVSICAVCLLAFLEWKNRPAVKNR